MSETPQERLDALGQVTQETDGANPDPAAAAEQAKAEQQASEADIAAKEWAAIPFMLGHFAAMIEPELSKVYSEERCLLWGRSAHQVALKYGWTGPDKVPEIALLINTGIFALPTIFLIRSKLAEMKEGKATGLLAKVGLWWRARKASKATDPAKAAKEEGAGGGGQ